MIRPVLRPGRKTKRALAIAAFTLASCSSTIVPATTPTRDTVTLKLYATTPMIPLLHDLTAQYVQINPHFVFDTLTGNFQMMLDKLLSEPNAYLLTDHLPDDRPESTVMAWPLGQDGIAVIVHPGTVINQLTAEQLRSIYLGHVSNWRDVSGDDLDITVFSREDGSGTRAEFERLVMGARQTTQSAQVAPSSAAMVEGVSKTKGAVGYVSMSYVDDRVRALTIDDAAPTLDNVYANIYP
ncbi:MAG: substrate-binding domain-containing protein, partial [Anaerolineae bacterium]|nr:substrate-binding domain-containing protein [Anaerolineae bacterium]